MSASTHLVFPEELSGLSKSQQLFVEIAEQAAGISHNLKRNKSQAEVTQ